MRTHTTQAEVFRILKLLRSGVTEIGEIQKEVFIHEASIQRVVDKWENEKDSVKEDKPAKKKPKKKAAVDPLS